jgi:YD repeat-containing protein
VLNIASASGFQMVTDQFGRALKIVLGSQGLVERVEDSSGNVLAKYGYTTFDTKITLTSAQYADGSSKLYKYDNQKYPLILTGVIDEKSSSIGTGVQFVSWGIDDSGLTISSVNAGGVNGYNLVRSGSDISVMDPLGSTRHMSYSAIGGKSQLDRTDQPAGSGCAAAISSSNYDGNGNVTYEDDFNGNRVCYSYGGSGAGFGNLESSRVEGLSGQANANSAPSNCSAVTNVGAILPSGARKISTEWHPNWGLKTRQAQPLLTTAWVYNGQPDPFNGGQVINCVSAMYGAATLPTLPDGSPITVLCKKVEQATTDVNGSQGFTATPASNANGTTTLRQWTYSYNQYGQLLSMTDPLAHTSNYAYYSDVSFSGTGLSAAGHRTGDLLSVTNAAGHVTQFTAYDQAGHLLSSTEPTGLVNVYSYSPRGWLTAVKQCATAPCDVTANTNGLLTSYDYWPTGLLKQVTLPDGAFLSYTYDDAHRLIGVSDAAGNTVSYTLDNIGNRTGEQLMDSSGVLARNITRTYDALNRLQSVTGAAQ